MNTNTVIESRMGPAFPGIGWVPSPRYLLRRSRVLNALSGMEPGHLLEVGPGAGALMLEMERLGFTCQGLETSPAARQMANEVLSISGASARVLATPGHQWDKKFDYVMALDVLEHIEDDAAALAQWSQWIKPGGYLILSVPARMNLWTKGDDWAGHFRRYEKQQLIDLVNRNNKFRVGNFECYGFPLANFTEKASAPYYSRRIIKRSSLTGDARQSNNDRSGIDRSAHNKLFPLLMSPLGALAMRAADKIQSMFLDRDWGSGYMLLAKRPQERE